MSDETFAEAIDNPTCPSCGAPLPSGPALEQIVCPTCQAKVMRPGRVGQYKILRLIGQGGMGAVYEGFDEGLHRSVAIKVILKEKADEEFIKQFRTEAQSAARVVSPGVVGVYYSDVSNGQPYLVMELVESDSLDHMMASGPVPAARVLQIGEQIAQGLKAAADQGLVHGDVKPENILINADKQAKLADFGIAGLAGASAAKNNEVWGTPYYIAPETLRKQKVDLRADIYSLGGTLYHAIAGIPPFDGADAVEVMKARLLGPARPLQEVAPGCPEGVAKIIMRMLEAEPMRRYPNYDSLINDMRRELPAAGSSKRIKLKVPGAKANTTSMPMASVASPTGSVPRPYLKPAAKPGLSKGAMIGLLCGICLGIPLLVAGIVLAVVLSRPKATPEAVAESAPAASEPAGPSPKELAVQALDALREPLAARVTASEKATTEGLAIVKHLAYQAERAVLPDQTSWLAYTPVTAPATLEAALEQLKQESDLARGKAEEAEKAPNEMLRQLASAKHYANALALQAKADALAITAIDQVRTAALEAEDPTSAVEALKAKLQAYETATKDRALLPPLETMKSHWRKVVTTARSEMEAAVVAQKQAEKKAAEDARKAEAAERQKQEQADELASVTQFYNAVGAELDAFDAKAAESKFKLRTTHLKFEESKAAAKVCMEKFASYEMLKAWFVERAKDKTFRMQKVTDGDLTAGLTIRGKVVSWRSFVVDQRPLALRLLSLYLADDQAARKLRASERAELALASSLFLNHFFQPEEFEKSATLKSLSEKLASIAKGLPATNSAYERYFAEPAEAPAASVSE